MHFSNVETPGQKETVVVPSDLVGDSNWMEGIEQLLSISLRKYNRSVQCLGEGQILEALQLSEEAVNFCPYAPRLVHFASLLALQHGSLSRAWQYASHLEHLGSQEVAAHLRGAIDSAAAAWKGLLVDYLPLRQKYSFPGADVSFRELLLLAHSGDDLGLAETEYLRSVGIQSTGPSNALPRQVAIGLRYYRWWQAAAVGFCLVAIIIGSIALYRSHPPQSVGPVQEPRHVSMREQIAEISLLFSTNSIPRTELWHRLSDLGPFETEDDTTGLSVFRGRVAEEIFAVASEAYRQRDYAAVYDLLSLIDGFEVQREQLKQYRLGLAADELGHAVQATRALVAAINNYPAEIPFYHAEVLYRLARRGLEADRKGYAQLLFDRYPDSPYVNSHIRRLLAND
jgi:hypothetical protein